MQTRQNNGKKSILLNPIICRILYISILRFSSFKNLFSPEIEIPAQGISDILTLTNVCLKSEASLIYFHHCIFHKFQFFIQTIFKSFSNFLCTGSYWNVNSSTTTAFMDFGSEAKRYVNALLTRRGETFFREYEVFNSAN